MDHWRLPVLYRSNSLSDHSESSPFTRAFPVNFAGLTFPAWRMVSEVNAEHCGQWGHCLERKRSRERKDQKYSWRTRLQTPKRNTHRPLGPETSDREKSKSIFHHYWDFRLCNVRGRSHFGIAPAYFTIYVHHFDVYPISPYSLFKK